MVPQTETKAGAGFKAGVKDYRLTYYTPDYVVKDTDILAAFRMTPQPGVPPEECGAAVAAESSTGTWTTVWTDGLTSLDRYKGRCYDIEPVPGEDNQYIAYVAYPIDLFEEGSVTNMFTSIVGNVFGFKALRALRLEDLRIPPAYVKTFQGPPHGNRIALNVVSAFTVANNLSTLLNGKYLTKSLATQCLPEKQACSGLPDPDNKNQKRTKKIDPNVIAKGLQSLDNPMLSGSFNLVLSKEQINFLDTVAKKAFVEITSHDLFTPIPSTDSLGTAFLETDVAKTLNDRPGLYVIKNVENGMCIVGQTLNLRSRFNQYSSRSKETSIERNLINQNFYNAVQQISQKGINYNQAFQRYVVYTWVDKDNKALDIMNSLSLKNEMNYLEHRLIVAFFECNLCYNLNDVCPQLNKVDSLPTPPPTIESTQISTESPALIKSAHTAKPFKIGSLYFYSKPQYSQYRESLSIANRKKFKASPALRLELENNKNNPDATTRYLSEQEIKEAKAKGLFIFIEKPKK